MQFLLFKTFTCLLGCNPEMKYHCMCVSVSHSFNFFQCAFSNVPPERLHNHLQNHTPYIYLIFPCVLFHVPCAFSCVSSDGCIVALFAFMRLLTCVYHQMCPQIASMSRCIVTFIAFVCVFKVSARANAL